MATEPAMEKQRSLSRPEAKWGQRVPLGMEANAFSRWPINAFERAQSTLPHSVIRQGAPPIERWRLPESG